MNVGKQGGETVGLSVRIREMRAGTVDILTEALCNLQIRTLKSPSQRFPSHYSQTAETFETA
jgi:hypothetical protein